MTNPVGRPCEYTQEIADRICAELAQGTSLRTVCKADDMPSCVTVFAWMRRFPEFLKQYETAKAESADYLVEEMLDIADDGTNDWMEKYGKDGESIGWALNGEHVQRSRLRVDTRKWAASKLKPKKYGERIIQQGDKDADPIQHEHNIKNILQSIDGKSSGLPVAKDAGTLDKV